jgi:UDP-2,3-diacylglucosamine pyrophosphatase LpxH
MAAAPSRRRPRARQAARVRTLWISDVHLGFSGSQAARLARFLSHYDCEKLYLVGDIIDGWKMKSHFYWSPDHTRVIQKVLAKARRGTEVYYIAGNHDSFLRPFLRGPHDYGNVHLADQVVHTTADGRKLLVLHGDRFDDVIGLRWLAQAGDVGYEALLWASLRINQMRRRLGQPELPLSSATKMRVKSAVQYLSGFDERVVHLCRMQGYRGVVCGHTHHAEIRYLRDGVTSYNCGDWVESCTALDEDASGDIQILRAPPLLAQRPGAAAAGRRSKAAGAGLQGAGAAGLGG